MRNYSFYVINQRGKVNEMWEVIIWIIMSFFMGLVIGFDLGREHGMKIYDKFLTKYYKPNAKG
jgi:membrane protein DedA with SNARE-associated domain